jgi:low temperature requirement A protein (LtrA)
LIGDAEREHEHGDEHRVTPLELFFDLVFVFAITQVTSLLARNPTWAGVLRGIVGSWAVRAQPPKPAVAMRTSSSPSTRVRWPSPVESVM